jgi:leucyl/phenylalanyl-tRNA--protein transferase
VRPADAGSIPPVPIDPGPCRWAFPDGLRAVSSAAGSGELVATGADLEPSTLLAAYRAGLFPMPLRRHLIGWWSPDPRGILPLDGLRVSRSLRRSLRRYEVRVDTAFDEVIAACADRRRDGAWIDRDVEVAYRRLHRLGWAHSVEAWDDDGLAGGLYGVAIGGLFAGESMFHRHTDASKVALVGLVERLAAGGGALLDVQWVTAHLASLGALAVPRAEYHRRLTEALGAPQLRLEPVADDPPSERAGAGRNVEVG